MMLYSVLAVVLLLAPNCASMEYFVRAVLDPTSSKRCSASEIAKVQESIFSYTDRNLSTNRELALNCARVCRDYDAGACVHDYPRCRTYAADNDDFFNRRDLAGIDGDFMVLDDILVHHDSWYSSWFYDPFNHYDFVYDSVSLQECSVRKEALREHLVASASGLSRPCQRLIGEPSTVECVGVMDD